MSFNISKSYSDDYWEIKIQLIRTIYSHGSPSYNTWRWVRSSWWDMARTTEGTCSCPWRPIVCTHTGRCEGPWRPSRTWNAQPGSPTPSSTSGLQQCSVNFRKTLTRLAGWADRYRVPCMACVYVCVHWARSGICYNRNAVYTRCPTILNDSSERRPVKVTQHECLTTPDNTLVIKRQSIPRDTMYDWRTSVKILIRQRLFSHTINSS